MRGDAIKPGATPERIEFARRRAEIALRIQDIQRDVDSWNAAHPNEAPIVMEWDLTDDVAEAVAAQAAERR